MKPRMCTVTMNVLFLATLATLGSLGAWVQADDLPVGEVETFLALPVGNRPEGIAFDRDGNLFYGNRPVVPGGLDSELRKVTPGGKETVIATFATSPASALLGLVTDGGGNVWAAVDEGPDHGVWKVSGSGKNKERIDGSENMDLPNALTFDAEGNLYVTDSGPVVPPVGGAIWRLTPGSEPSLELWSDDPALAPLPIDPFGFPLPGANGIAFFPPDSLYVANTEKGQVFRIPILPDKSAGASEEVTPFFSVPTVDGIAVDVHGNVHGVLPGHAVLGTPPLVKVDPGTGAITRTTLAAFDGLFDIPLSLAFDTLPGGRETVYVTNGDLPVAPVGMGPSVARANLGVKGFLLK